MKWEKEHRREKYLLAKRESERKERERAACLLQRNARVKQSNRQFKAWLERAIQRVNAV